MTVWAVIYYDQSVEALFFTKALAEKYAIREGAGIPYRVEEMEVLVDLP